MEKHKNRNSNKKKKQKQKQQQQKDTSMNSSGGCPKKTAKAFFNNKQVYKLQGQTVKAMQAVGFQGHAGPIEIAAEGNEALAAWVGQYDELWAEVGELAKAVHQTLEVDESFLQSTRASGRSLTADMQKWMLEHWAQSRDFGPNRTSDVVAQADREEIPQTLADAMDAFRRKVDEEFGWQNKDLAQNGLCSVPQQVGVEQPNHPLAEWCNVGDCWDDCWMTSCQNLF